MLRRITAVLVIALAILGAAALRASDTAGEMKLQQAITFVDKRDFVHAIPLLNEVSKSSDRALAARALLYLGDVQQRQGNENAIATYERITTGFANTEAAKEAERRLKALTGDRSSGGLSQHRVATGDDADQDAFITLDGRFLVRPDWDTDNLVVRDLVTRETKLLDVKAESKESNGSVGTVMPSPDLKWIVYQWYATASGQELRIISNEAGGKSRVLIAKNPDFIDFVPAGWSADGKRILVTAAKKDQSWELVWVSRDDGKITPLKFLGWRVVPGRPPSVSSDGQYIAYSALPEDPGKPPTPNYLLAPGALPNPQHIYVLRADGSQPETELVKGANINENPIWTSDGKRILFVSNRSDSFALWSVGVDNGKAEGSPSLVQANVTGRITPIGMTRAGSFYYIPEVANGAGNDIFLAQIDPSNGKLRGSATRAFDDFVDWNRSPAWSPDGKRIAFKRRRPGNNSIPDPFDLIVHDLESGIETKFPDTRLDGASPIWFHDGKSLLMRRNYDVRAISRVDIQTGAMRSVEAIAHSIVPSGARGPMALSPDDKMLYLTVPPPFGQRGANEPGQLSWSIVSFDLATGEQKPVWTSNGPLAGSLNFAVSPDGRSLAVTLRRSEWKETRLIRVGIDGSNPHEIASAVSPGMLAWTPDGRGIFFVALDQEQSRLMRIPSEGGKPEFTGITIRNSGDALSVSPEGNRIIFGDSTSTGRALWAIDNLSSQWATTNVSASRN